MVFEIKVFSILEIKNFTIIIVSSLNLILSLLNIAQNMKSKIFLQKKSKLIGSSDHYPSKMLSWLMLPGASSG